MATVLVVDDNRNQRLLYEQELGEEGYQVILAEDGQEAARMLDICSPDVVVLEVGGRGLCGLDLVMHLQKCRPHIPIIANTTRAERHHLVAGLVDAYVIKSSDLSLLKTVIQLLLAGRRRGWRESRHLDARPCSFRLRDASFEENRAT